MKKQLFSFALVLALVITLTACGGNTDTPTGDRGTASGTSSKPADNLLPTDLEETPIDEFEYQYDPETQGIMIVKYTGSSIKVRIPEKIEDEPVTCIGDMAFRGGRTMSVYIPNSVKVIGKSAFAKCTGLTSIMIPDSVTEIGTEAFWECTGLATVQIGNGVTEIGGAVFAACTKFTSISIPDNVTAIGRSAFKDCTGLTNVAIPDSVARIGYYRSKEFNYAAFDGCSNITVTYKGTAYSYENIEELYKLFEPLK